MPESTIIPIASGKGGVGKSMFTANLAIALAELGHETVAVDLDLGGSNMYSFLGLGNEYPGIGDYLKARNPRLELDDLLVPTGIPNLRFLPGDVQTPFMANIPYAQKMRFIRNLKKISARYILLDLSAGSSYNTLDLFGITPMGILVTTFERTAIMNMFTFLKNFMFRTIEKALSGNQQLRKLIRESYIQPVITGRVTAQELLEQISGIDPEIGNKIKDLFQNCRPRLIFNIGNHPDELKILNQIDVNVEKNLLLRVDFMGFIFDDRSVPESINKRVTLIPHYRDSLVAEDIIRIADRIVRLWDQPMNNTAEILQKMTRQIYESRL